MLRNAVATIGFSTPNFGLHGRMSLPSGHGRPHPWLREVKLAQLSEAIFGVHATPKLPLSPSPKHFCMITKGVH